MQSSTERENTLPNPSQFARTKIGSLPTKPAQKNPSVSRQNDLAQAGRSMFERIGHTRSDLARVKGGDLRDQLDQRRLQLKQ
ncbi:hypothetical protein TorRG33x02_126510 [Trema orientale]|uniref:Uncharacterized protein n=1 Tax=Trema orientale TaxID=63057 RepID=A0A2P5F1E7_TREOI|nr:hypothetical protein TorRG33x02_126510 [Trema orientale]